jgi:hypothetical protein
MRVFGLNPVTKLYSPAIITNVATNDLLLVYFTNTPFTQTDDYSGLYEGSHLVNYKNIFPYREASLCNNPCSSYK